MATNNYYGGPTSAGKLQVTNGNVYLGVDASGNFHPDTSNNVASLQAVLVTANTVNANTINTTVFNFKQANLDVSGNVIVGGLVQANQFATPGGFSVDSSGNVVANSINVVNEIIFNNLNVKTISTPGGFSVDASGNVVAKVVNSVNETVSGILTATRMATPGGFSVDASGNVSAKIINATNETVSGTLTATQIITPGGLLVDTSGGITSNSLNTKQISTPGGFSVDTVGGVTSNSITVSGNAAFNNNVSMNNMYLSGSSFLNKEYTNVLTVGDSLYGNGVSMKSSGTTLNILGITQDTSASVFPVNVAVNGNLLIDISGNLTVNTLSTPSGISMDGSGNLISNSAIANGDIVNNLQVNIIGANQISALGMQTTSLVSSNVTTSTMSASSGAFSVDALGNVSAKTLSTQGNLTVTGLISSQKSFAQAILNSDFVVVNDGSGTNNIIPFLPQANYDPNNWISSNTFKPTVSGFYNVSLTGWWSGEDTSGWPYNTNQVNLQIKDKTGNTQLILQSPDFSSSPGMSLSGSKIIMFDGLTDFVQCTAYTSSSTGQQTLQKGSSAGSGTSFSARLL